MEEIDLNLLKEDFERFSHLHSWYKHLPLDGTNYYVFLHNSYQKRNIIDPQPPKNPNGPHWIFVDNLEYAKSLKINKVYKVNFGPFLRGNENKNCTQNYHGFHIIKNYNSNFNEWLNKNYPQCGNINDEKVIAHIFESEYKKYEDSLFHEITSNNFISL
jgi:hypothetical protein